MKKIILAICMIIMLITMTACGNQNLGFGNYIFTRVHFSVGGKEACSKINSWCDNELGCEVELDDGNILYLSEGTYILIKDECPICGV